MPVVGVADAVALLDAVPVDPDPEDVFDGADDEECSPPAEAAKFLLSLSLFRVRLEMISDARLFLRAWDLPDTKANTEADGNNQQSCQSCPQPSPVLLSLARLVLCPSWLFTGSSCCCSCPNGRDGGSDVALLVILIANG